MSPSLTSADAELESCRCVEGAVVEAGIMSIRNGAPQLLHFGVSDETAWDVGLACGGEIDVYVRPLDVPLFEFVRKEWESDESIVKVIVIEGSAELEGSEFSFKEKVPVFGDSARSHVQPLTAIADHIPKVETSQSLALQIDRIGSIEIFVDIMQPPPTLVIVGGVHIAIPLVNFANALGYKTIIIDPRKKFGSRERFPHAGRVINSWPESAFREINLTPLTAVAVLTHDPKIDDPALRAALPSPAFYIGALGSQKTQSQRRQRLLGLGLSHQEIDRLHGPIGLELGGSSPEEIALGIMAEVVRVRHQDQP